MNGKIQFETAASLAKFLEAYQGTAKFEVIENYGVFTLTFLGGY